MAPGVRRYPRYDVQASVSLEAGRERLAFTVRNMSGNGLLLAMSSEQACKIAVGTTTPLDICDPEVPGSAFSVHARVVRHDDMGAAVTWDDDADIASATVFLEQLYAKR